MSESAEPVQAELEACCNELRWALKSNPEMMADPADQLVVENAVAAGIAVLAGEELPTPSTVEPVRRILAKDLLITADLVHRSLQQHAR